ncbi:MAG: carbohydrate kinase family protein [Candidatus Delongbacteria bacterium]|nr:carbohydrate kinase family protein [Candidatus Delongbacteria bacterium]
MKIACFSVAAMDYFPQQKKYYAGGNSLNQAIRFRQLGHESSFIGALGTDTAGDQIEALLNKYHVDITHSYRIPGITACNELGNDGKGERTGIDGAWQNGVYGSFKLKESDWKYIENYDIWSTHANGINYSQTLSHKKTNNFLVVDFLHFDTYELLQQGFDYIDIAYFGGIKNQLSDLVSISKYFKGIIVLTLGAEGSIAIKNGDIFEQEALPIKKVIDTTGCGDAFQAGFSAEYYVTKDIKKALLVGATLGREAASNYGGVPWL